MPASETGVSRRQAPPHRSRAGRHTQPAAAGANGQLDPEAVAFRHPETAQDRCTVWVVVPPSRKCAQAVQPAVVAHRHVAAAARRAYVK